MSWDSSDRRSRLPADWPQLVRATAARALKSSKLGIAQCEARLPSGKRCPRVGTDCDHKVAGDDHNLRNLQWLCDHHHSKKSAKEGFEARMAFKRSKYRPREGHPGDVR